MPWQVKFFQNQRGDYPVKDFIIKQNEKTYAKILGLELPDHKCYRTLKNRRALPDI